MSATDTTKNHRSFVSLEHLSLQTNAEVEPVWWRVANLQLLRAAPFRLTQRIRTIKNSVCGERYRDGGRKRSNSRQTERHFFPRPRYRLVVPVFVARWTTYYYLLLSRVGPPVRT